MYQEEHSMQEEIETWWRQIEKIIKRDEAMLKPETDVGRLMEILPYRLVHVIAEMLHLPLPDYYSLDEKQLEEKLKHFHLTDTVISYMGSELVEVTHNKNNIDDLTSPKYENPYASFFKMHPESVAVWRGVEVSSARSDLNKLAQTVTENIAKSFVQWFDSLGGVSSTKITVKNLKEMFEIGTQLNNAISLHAEIKQMVTVPDGVAQAFHMPKKSKRACLHREIQRDIDASKKSKKVIAFGKAVPENVKRVPPKLQIEEFLKPNIYKEQLQSMARVWTGITHLKSTRAFCDYLVKFHPELQPPKYLADNGMIRKLDTVSQAQIM